METGIYARESPSLECYVQLGVASQQVLSVAFPSEPDEAATHCPSDEAGPPILERIFTALEGAEERFQDVELVLTLPTDERQVLEAVREIPYGEQRGIEGVLGLVSGLDSSSEGDLERARVALADNPVPLLIADHRVRNAPSGAPPRVEQKLRSLEGL